MSAPQAREERAHEQHALEADVHDARALGHQAAEAAKISGVAKRSVAAVSAPQTTTTSSLVEVGLGRAVAPARRDAPRRRSRSTRGAARPPRSARRRAPSRDQREHERRHGRAHRDRRQRDEERDDATATPAQPSSGARSRASRAAGASRRRRRGRVAALIRRRMTSGSASARPASERPRDEHVTSIGADTKSTTRPWMMS